MDCEQAFMVLTRAPISGASTQEIAVLAHLDQCDSCRQIAEALRPAPRQAHEALSVEEEAALPAYRVREEPVLAPLGSTGASRSVPRTAPGIDQRPSPPPPRGARRAHQRLAASRRVVVQERADLLEWVVAISLLLLSATGMLVLLAFGANWLLGLVL